MNNMIKRLLGKSIHTHLEQLKRHGRKFMQALQFALARGAEQRIGQVAGSLTFTTVLSLVPILAVALALFTAFPLFAKLRSGFEQFMFDSLMPAQTSGLVLKYINQFAAKAKGLTVAGLVFLLITSISMLLTIDKAFNHIWRVKKRRPLVRRVLVYWAVLTLGPLLLGISLMVTSSLSGVSSDVLSELPLMVRAVLEFLPLLLTGGAYAALFVVIPNREVLWRDALIGGFIAALLIELTKQGFALYITKYPTYTAVYGAFAALPIFFLWIFLSWLVTLFGATVAATLPLLRDGRWERKIRPGTDFADALAMLHVLYQARHQSRPGLSLEQLCQAVKINPYDGERLLLQMQHLGYLVRAADSPQHWLWVADAKLVTAAPLYQLLAFDGHYLACGLTPQHEYFAETYAALVNTPVLQRPLEQLFQSGG